MFQVTELGAPKTIKIQCIYFNISQTKYQTSLPILSALFDTKHLVCDEIFFSCHNKINGTCVYF